MRAPSFLPFHEFHTARTVAGSNLPDESPSCESILNSEGAISLAAAV